MSKTERHSFNKKMFLLDLELTSSFVEEIVDDPKISSSDLGILQAKTRKVASLSFALGSGTEAVCRYLHLGTEAAAALFALASVESGTLDLPLGGRVVRLTATGPNSYTHPSRWCEGFFQAAICRDVRSLDLLCQTPPAVFRASSTKTDEYHYVYVAALQAFWKAEAETPNLLLQALRLAKPGNAKIASADYLLFVIMSQMELLYQVLIRDEAAFNASLIKSLEYHKRYWTSSEDLSDESIGFLPIGLIAIASFAHEQGMEIAEIDSGYFPMSIVKGACAV
jgi:hypothetical protein